ncbi:MAG TPA: putative sulfate/molybdate transporter [Methanospirillum sp.]|nr:putative sulfate/molybdate transporter [Methanospirillum sp.]
MPISERLKDCYLQIRSGEISGSVGNFGTILPLFCAVSLTTGMPLSTMLLLCGVWYIITGIVYRIPIPVEPLKAVAAISIADHLDPGVIAASGIFIGLIFIILGLSGGMEWLQRKVPESVIRGIQLGLGLLLIRSALFDLGLLDAGFFLISVGIIVLFIIAKHRWNVPDHSALIVLVFGGIILIFAHGVPQVTIPPVPVLVIPDLMQYVSAGLLLVLPQFPLTLGNAVLATSLLACELYKRDIRPDRLSITVGVMSLSTSFLGGFPMCHGAGGVAAHYRFGARTGIAMGLGGIVLIALAACVSDPGTLAAMPKGIFGALLLTVGIELILYGMKTRDQVTTGLMAIIALPFGMAVAFCAGLIMAFVVGVYRVRKEKSLP